MPLLTKDVYFALIELFNVSRLSRLWHKLSKQTDENLRQSDTWTANVQQSSLIDYKHNHNQYLIEWTSILGPG